MNWPPFNYVRVIGKTRPFLIEANLLMIHTYIHSVKPLRHDIKKMLFSLLSCVVPTS